MQKILRKMMLSLLAWGGILQAEVEQITVRWNAMICLETCIPGLESSLRAIYPVRDLQIDSRSGVAVMGWDPNYPFTYEPFREAFGAVGLNLGDMRLRVRGTMVHDSENFYIISTGDYARFLVLGPIQTSGDRYVPRYSIYSYPLTSLMKEQFLEAEERGYTVSISGPLYLPAQYPRILIAERIKIFDRESKMDPRYRRY